MNFFEQQDRARRSTTWLIVLFVLAVLAIITAVNVAVFGVATIVGENSHRQRRTHYDFSTRRVVESAPPPQFPAAQLFLAVTGVTLIVILGGSLFKIAMLSQGGHAVARMMGARQVTPSTKDPRDKQLMNVVEEMSIASGVQVPGVYVLDNEPGINAFAAGFRPADSVVTVTRGALDTLTRDELQGVIGHEFSHILNGDTRLNIRLIGILHGILVIGLIGYYLLRSLQYSRSGGKDKGAGILAMALLGVSLLVIGYVGMFFANLIQAAVCRSREFLADASSVQFTRNPSGIAGALKKIGGGESLDERGASELVQHNAVEIAHMFFARGIAMGLVRLTSTHPPLEERIRAIEPTWDGRFIADISIVRPPPVPAEVAMGFGPTPRALPVAVRAEDVVRRVGSPTPLHVTYAAALLNEMPRQIAEAARDPFGSRAIVFCLLLADDADASEHQVELLAREMDTMTLEATKNFSSRVRALGERSRLPLLDLAMPALRQLSTSQLEQFKHAVQTLIYADTRVTFGEYVLSKILTRSLVPPGDSVRRGVVRYVAIRPVLGDVGVLLSALAVAGNENPTAKAAAYSAGAGRLDSVDMPPMTSGTDLAALDDSLTRLAACAPGVKRRIIDAAAYCVAADGIVQVREAELLRAVAATLDCPLPPIVSPPAASAAA